MGSGLEAGHTPCGPEDEAVMLIKAHLDFEARNSSLRDEYSGPRKLVDIASKCNMVFDPWRQRA